MDVDVLPIEVEDDGSDLRLKPARSIVIKKAQPKYKPLAQEATRLVILKKCKQPEDDVAIQLQQVQFNKLRGNFAALSYHWGSDVAEKPVFLLEDNDDTGWTIPVNGLITTADSSAARDAESYDRLDTARRALREEAFTVRQNLYDALKRLRSEKHDTIIWIDALSINQADKVEKTAQVKRIGEIYSSAHTVHIWLGTGGIETDTAFDFVENLHKNPTRITAMINNSPDNSHWEGLVYLMRKTWFTRRWVIQEMALAKNAVAWCGRKKIHWTDLRDAISIFSENFETIRNGYKALQPGNDRLGGMYPLHAIKLVEVTESLFRDQRSSRGTHREAVKSLEWLISTMSVYDTSDPRDTVNCFRNIAKETYVFGRRQAGTIRAAPFPQVNYEEDLLTTYIKFVDWVITDSQSLDILCRRWAIPEKTDDQELEEGDPPRRILPSWIQIVDQHDRMDNALGLRRHGDSFVGEPGRSTYRASGSLSYEVELPLLGSKSLSSRLPPSHTRPFTRRAESPRSGRPTSNAAGPPPQLLLDTSMVENGNASGLVLEPQEMYVEPQANLPSTDQHSHTRAPVDNQRHTSSLGTSAAVEDGTEAFPPLDTQAPVNEHLHSPTSEHSLTPHYHTLARRTSNASSVRAHARTMSTTSNPNIREYGPERASKEERKVLRQLINAPHIDASIWVKGVEVGRIKKISSAATEGVVGSDVLHALSSGNEEKPGIVPDRVWRSLVAERGADGKSTPPLYHRSCRLALSKIYHSGRNLNVKEMLEQTQIGFMKPFLRRVEAVVWNRCFFRVEKSDQGDDLFGFGPGNADDDDVLCILFGCSVPVVLRPTSNRDIGQYYVFIGEAYVYGIMDGEFVESLGGEQQCERRSKKFRIL